jgi:fructose-1,6-bisphosphatase/sedoheptulose 1,7-bisphosphatase-like protein
MRSMEVTVAHNQRRMQNWSEDKLLKWEVHENVRSNGVLFATDGICRQQLLSSIRNCERYLRGREWLREGQIDMEKGILWWFLFGFNLLLLFLPSKLFPLANIYFKF